MPMSDLVNTTTTAENVIFKDVVIIGNGPSALSLAAFLSGYQPYYNLSKPHPNKQLRKKLEENADQSILFQDLEYLSSGLEGRSSRCVSLLYDALCRPNADLGEQHESCLKWIKTNSNQQKVDYLCLGEFSPGGAWQRFSSDLLTLSFGSWLDLPAYSFRDFVRDKDLAQELNFDPDAQIESRVPCWAIAEYYQGYVAKLDISQNFRNNMKVISVRKNSDFWEIDALSTLSNITNSKQFKFKAKQVILACGTGKPKRLNVPNESLSQIYHTNGILENLIASLKSKCKLGDKAAINGPTNRLLLTNSIDIDKSCDSDLLKNQRSSYTCHKEWFKDFCRNMSKSGSVSFDEIYTELGTFYQDFFLEKLLKMESTGSTVPRRPHLQSIFAPKSTPSGLNWKSLHASQSLHLRDGRFLARHALHCAPVLVVGDGLSAADAISRLLVASVPVVHTFRKMGNDPQNLFAKLSRAVYPDYHSVYQLMTSRHSNNLYTVYPGAEILRFDKIDDQQGGKIRVQIKSIDNTATMASPADSKNRYLTCSAVIVDIGSEPDLQFMMEPDFYRLIKHENRSIDSRANPVLVNPYTSECRKEKNLYALGPLIGDNYVRFIVGGAMACGANLLKHYSSYKN